MINIRLIALVAPALVLVTLMVVPPAPAQNRPNATAPSAAIDGAIRKKVIETAIAKITSIYVFPDKAPLIARALRRKLSSGAYDEISDPQLFAKAVTGDIAAVAKDKHMRLFWSAERLPPFGDAAKADPAEAARQQQRLARANYAIPKVEVLAGNIGYLKMDGFFAAEDAGQTFSAAMAFLKHADAMIFDLRKNHGGDPGMVALALSYFVPPDTHINSFHQRGKAVDDQFWALPYVPGGRWSIDKPVYVLTSSETGSAAEEFAYDVQQLKRGVVVGAVTWGGANPGDVAAIDEHFAIFIPDGAAVNPVSKTNWEGVGVQPDIVVEPEAALETARRMAIEKLIAGASSEHREELKKLLTPDSTP